MKGLVSTIYVRPQGAEYGRHSHGPEPADDSRKACWPIDPKHNGMAYMKQVISLALMLDLPNHGVDDQGSQHECRNDSRSHSHRLIVSCLYR